MIKAISTVKQATDSRISFVGRMGYPPFNIYMLVFFEKDGRAKRSREVAKTKGTDKTRTAGLGTARERIAI
jgi:hypothetical protein